MDIFGSNIQTTICHRLFHCTHINSCQNSHGRKKSPENYPPILVQTVMRNAISKYGKKSSIIESEQKIKLDSEEYFQQVQITAKGFISLGLSPMHGWESNQIQNFLKSIT